MIDIKFRRRDALFMGLAGASMLGAPILKAQAAPQINDIVVLVPGIMGSVLKRNGNVVWGFGTEPLLKLVQGDLGLSFLRLSSSDSRVVAERLFSTTTLLPGFWKLDGYTETRDLITDGLGLRMGENYFEFPYDWRLDNRLAARELLVKMREWLGKWREISRNSRARVIFVCHSMGGLIVQYACEVLGGWEETRAVFTIGTPYQGSVKALDRLINPGWNVELAKTVSSFDSTYQLLPTYKCIEDSAGTLRRLHEAPEQFRERIDMKRHSEMGLSFHLECDRAAKANRGRARWEGRTLHITQASTHQTLCSIRATGQNFVAQSTFGRLQGGGDGTVPGFNYAQPPESSATSRSTFHCNQLHGSMQIFEPALTNLIYSLRGGGKVVRGVARMSMEASEVVSLGESIVVELRFARAPDRTPFNLVDVSSGKSVYETVVEGPQTEFTLRHKSERVGIFRAVLGDQKLENFCSDLVCVI